MQRTLFPPIEPYSCCWLDTGDGHQVYYEECGNRKGIPVVFLHGGPGSGCSASHRRFFDPEAYRIILFDQRGTGRSRPLGALENNKTGDLVADMERLRCYLGVDRWLLFGGSWGVLLALAYASRHPAAVSGMILRGIFLGRPSELDWYLRGVRAFAPEAWERLVAAVPGGGESDLLAHFHQAVNSRDQAVAYAAAQAWREYEEALMALGSEEAATVSATGPRLLARVRVQLHYLAAGCFVEAGVLLESLARLPQFPVWIIQGGYDMVCPPITAAALRRVWPQARYHLLPGAGHSAMDAGILAALVSATEAYKQLPAGRVAVCEGSR